MKNKNGTDWAMWAWVVIALILVIAVAFIVPSLVRQVPAWWWAR